MNVCGRHSVMHKFSVNNKFNCFRFFNKTNNNGQALGAQRPTKTSDGKMNDKHSATPHTAKTCHNRRHFIKRNDY